VWYALKEMKSDREIACDTSVLKMLKESKKNELYHVYAVVAPSISSQFYYAKLGQVISGLKKLGFYSVVEAALGADMVAYEEAKELSEKGFITTSCCPSFVEFIKKNYPKVVDKISHNLSPMARIAKYIKDMDSSAKIVFIGPCTAKKMEIKKEEVKKYVDSVLTFEELQSLLDSKSIDITTLEVDVLDNASYYGRIFARSGGVADAVRQALKEQGKEDFPYNPISCDGIDACRLALAKASNGTLPNNLIEGMACVGGCIGGPCCLTHEVRDKNEVDKYGREAHEKDITSAISVLQNVHSK